MSAYKRFAKGENLGSGGIHFHRSFQIQKGSRGACPVGKGVDRAVCDYIAGMTDPFAIERFSELFIPMSWTVK